MIDLDSDEAPDYLREQNTPRRQKDYKIFRDQAINGGA
jgi:hypothetical protein